MLTQANTTVPQSMANPRQIAVFGQAAAGTVYYTVPTGRKFVGALYTVQNSQGYAYVRVTSNSGTAVDLYVQSLYNSGATPMQVVLLPGTVIASTSATAAITLLGVESDL